MGTAVVLSDLREQEVHDSLGLLQVLRVTVTARVHVELNRAVQHVQVTSLSLRRVHGSGMSPESLTESPRPDESVGVGDGAGDDAGAGAAAELSEVVPNNPQPVSETNAAATTRAENGRWFKLAPWVNAPC
jgi:hypothetical protein